MKKKTDIRDDDLLALALKDVKPLPGRTIKKTAKHKIINPKQPSEGLAAFDRHSVKPKHSIQRPVSSHGNTPGLDRRTAMRMKRGQMQIEGRLDLHGFHQNEARGALANFINSAFNRKKRCVLIITGKGLHVKKPESTGILRKWSPSGSMKNQTEAKFFRFLMPLAPMAVMEHYTCFLKDIGPGKGHDTFWQASSGASI